MHFYDRDKYETYRKKSPVSSQLSDKYLKNIELTIDKVSLSASPKQYQRKFFTTYLTKLRSNLAFKLKRINDNPV